jgi:hypothetical protein
VYTVERSVESQKENQAGGNNIKVEKKLSPERKFKATSPRNSPLQELRDNFHQPHVRRTTSYGETSFWSARDHSHPPIRGGYAPGGPIYAQGGPTYAPSGPIYAQGGPTYAPGGPTYAPGGPTYAPGGPTYAPGGPIYAQGGPTYAPGGPTYAPGGPTYAPGGPTYAPGGPTYAPGGPTYAPGGGYAHGGGVPYDYHHSQYEAPHPQFEALHPVPYDERHFGCSYDPIMAEFEAVEQAEQQAQFRLRYRGLFKQMSSRAPRYGNPRY